MSENNTNKLVGHNYTTPDLVAKVTGKAKYAEDYRVEGMLFAKLLLSPMPHARVVRIDTERGAGDAGREGDPHRRRPAAGRRRRQPRRRHHRQHAQRARPDQRAAVRRRADSGRRGGGRSDGRRSDREDSRSSSSRCRSSSIRSRACGPAARTPERRATCGCGPRRRRPAQPGAAPAAAAAGPEGPGAEVDRGRLRRRERRPAAARQAHRRVDRSAISRPGSSRRISSSTRRSSATTPAISRSRRARRWPTGRTASSTCTARRRARCGPSAPSRGGSASIRPTS